VLLPFSPKRRIAGESVFLPEAGGQVMTGGQVTCRVCPPVGCFWEIPPIPFIGCGVIANGKLTKEINMVQTLVTQKYRLVTRSDMDGLLAAVLLRDLEIIDEIKFVHPKDVQDGKIDLGPRDITTNLPYVEDVYLSFDHHSSEIQRVDDEKQNHIIDADSPSTARVVYEYFGGKQRFSDIPEDLMAAVDKADSAAFTMEDVLDPSGWELLSFLMDPRTGLGRFREFRVSNYTLMMDLIDFCKHHPIEDILKLPDVNERVELYFQYQEQAKEQITRCSCVYDNLVVFDNRSEEVIWPTNRFTIYSNLSFNSASSANSSRSSHRYF
jgi:hypothetical protein